METKKDCIEKLEAEFARLLVQYSEAVAKFESGEFKHVRGLIQMAGRLNGVLHSMNILDPNELRLKSYADLKIHARLNAILFARGVEL